MRPSTNPSIDARQSIRAYVVLACGLTGTLIGLLSLTSWPAASEPREATLIVLASASTQAAMEEISNVYTAETGIKVQLEFAGSNTLLARIRENNLETTDVFVAADDYYALHAIEQGLAMHATPLAIHVPVLATKPGSSIKAQKLHELLAAEWRLSLGNSEKCAIGRAVRQASRDQIWNGETLWRHLELKAFEEGQWRDDVLLVAQDIAEGNCDVGIIWNSTATLPEFKGRLQTHRLDDFLAQEEIISAAVLKRAGNPSVARHFVRFLAASDRGGSIFQKYGIQPMPSPMWEASPPKEGTNPIQRMGDLN